MFRAYSIRRAYASEQKTLLENCSIWEKGISPTPGPTSFPILPKRGKMCKQGTELLEKSAGDVVAR